MAGANLLTLLDDITTILDDVAIMTRKAVKQTAGVLGDDLALNAEQVSGVSARRELPVVWAVAKGSFLNKLILVPAALAISVLAPWAITPLLMLGGGYLCFEGMEKLAHRFLPHAAHEAKPTASPAPRPADFERRKIRGAIRTDFILSAEIIVITLGTVGVAPFATKLGTLSAIALLMTVGVYGLVAGIVKLDDLGLYWSNQVSGRLRPWLGHALLRLAPRLMQSLSVLGTAAMFLVGGGILVHGIALLHHAALGAGEAVTQIPALGAVLGVLVSMLINALVGLLAGGLLLALVSGVQRLRPAH